MEKIDTTLTWPEALVKQSICNDHSQIVNKLLQLQQLHLFQDWDEPGVNDNEKDLFLRQAERLDVCYPGGLTAYISRARDLLQASLNGENPMDGWTPSIPTGVNLVPYSEDYMRFESTGKTEIGTCGFILVAGGLGERLGYSGIKIALPTETITNQSYIALYCAQILAIQQRYSPPGFRIPLAIMVSDDTAAKTIELLRINSYFGLEQDQVTILKQEKVPALQSSNGDIAKISKYEIDTKPHGHGDVHSLMQSTGTADKWRGQGVRWCVFFQDTNSTGFITLAAFLGVSITLNLEVNSMTVPRLAKQAIGAIAKLRHNDGREMTINVEYNQLEPMLKATINPDGDVNDPVTGLSPFPGNINQLLFRLDAYCDNLHKSGGVVNEFVNPKYQDSTRTAFKKATRLECMMQDYPKILSATANVGFTMAPAWLVYNPCKNNVADASVAVKTGILAHSAFTAESDLYHAYATLLKLLGVSIAQAPPSTFLGISSSIGPRIVFHPSFAIFPSELQARFPTPSQVSICDRSTLVCKGDVVIRILHLDGSLRLIAGANTRITVDNRSSDGEEAVIVKNAGHVVQPTEPSSTMSEITAMRGYQIIVEEELVIESPPSECFQEYVFNGAELALP